MLQKCLLEHLFDDKNLVLSKTLIKINVMLVLKIPSVVQWWILCQAKEAFASALGICHLPRTKIHRYPIKKLPRLEGPHQDTDLQHIELL